MKKVNCAKTSAATLVLVLLLATVWGCSESPMQSLPGDGGPRLLMRAPSSIPLSASGLYNEAVISANDGGQLAVTGVVLEVPPHAVGNDTLFSLQIPDAGVFFCEFGTSGLVFEHPVKVTMSYSDADLNGVDESTIRIAWLNERSGVWEDIQCIVDPVTKTAVAYLDHFSAYGLISD